MSTKMYFHETKKAIIGLFILALASFFVSKPSDAAEYSSVNFTVLDSVLDAGSSSSTSASFGLGQSISQTAIGKSTSTSFQLWSGFQYFFKASPNVLSATAANGQVNLSWTIPATFLGASVSSYEVGTGIVSGSYTFENVGNVLAFSKTGLTNGTPYFFIVKAKTAAGTLLVYSNEVTSTPTAPVTPPPPPPGGGGPGLPPPMTPPPPPGPGNSSVVLSGLAYPGRAVTILRDGVIAAVTTADPGAGFNVQISSLAAGSYNFSLYATDETGKRSPPLNFQQTLADNVTTTVNNLFLGPTIGLSHTVIKQGEALSIFGYTTPESDVTLFVNSPNQFIEKIRSNKTGAYFKAFGTAVLEIGDHSSKSQTESVSLVSPFSEQAPFKVGTTSEETPADNCIRSDLNCDGKVNITDFSILLYYWNQTGPANARTDINKSGIVDLTDFSILLYDWTG